MPVRRRRRRWPGDGVCPFPVDPQQSALDAPAFWHAQYCAYVAILEAAPAGLGGDALHHPVRWTHRLAHRSGPGGDHFLFGEGDVIHRVWLRGDAGGRPLASLIPCDDMIETRLLAMSDLDRWVRGRSLTVTAGRPTSYQAQRLDLLLSILDRRSERQVTSHEIARRLIYPRLDVGRGAAWKSSPERRRTQRLVREAEALAAGGYRALLRGPAGRQR